MATPERNVKVKAMVTLKKMGAYHCTPVTGGFGNSGVPDILVCHKGRFIAIECKAGKGKLTALQQHNLNGIELTGGIALVINETNVANLQQLIEEKL
jgi:Holliday junction resolvase